MRWSSVLVLLILMAPTTLAVEIGLQGDIVSFCQETRTYCENEVESFAYETDLQIQLRIDEVYKTVQSEARIFKFTNSLSTFIAVLLALSLHDLLRGRRELQRELVKNHLLRQQGQDYPRPVSKNRRKMWFFVVVTALALLTLSILYSVGYIG